MSDPGPQLEATRELPDVELIRIIGHGTYGEVWLGRNKVSEKLLAAKIIPLGPEDMGRAARELTALRRFLGCGSDGDEHLVRIHHVGQTERLLYCLMDPADDVTGDHPPPDPSYRPATLATRLQGGRLIPEECVSLARQLLGGLGSLHAHGLTHRDVKPGNCLFIGGKLKLADFGLVASTDGRPSLLGTPGYMPPDGRMDERADVYAAGLVIYQMLTGLPIEEFPRLPPEVIKARRDPVVRGLNQLILRACDTDHARRYADAGAMSRALENLQRNGRGRRLRTLASAAVTAALLVGAVLVWRHWRSSPVFVSFITDPFEAEIYLDGKPAVDPSGGHYHTPCTIPGLEPRRYRVAFRLPGKDNLDAGTVDFADRHEVMMSWPTTRPSSSSSSRRAAPGQESTLAEPARETASSDRFDSVAAYISCPRIILQLSE